jgi:hypothetical protein
VYSVRTTPPLSCTCSLSGMTFRQTVHWAVRLDRAQIKRESFPVGICKFTVTGTRSWIMEVKKIQTNVIKEKVVLMKHRCRNELCLRQHSRRPPSKWCRRESVITNLKADFSPVFRLFLHKLFNLIQFKQTGDHSARSSAEVYNVRSYTPIAPYVFIASRIIKHRDFTFYHRASWLER